MPEYTTLAEVGTAVGFALAYVMVGYLSRKAKNGAEKFDPKVAASTLVIGLVGGVVIVVQGLETNPAGITAAVGIATIAVDKAWNMFAPPEWGGRSPADIYEEATNEETTDEEATGDELANADPPQQNATDETTNNENVNDRFDELSNKLRGDR